MTTSFQIDTNNLMSSLIPMMTVTMMMKMIMSIASEDTSKVSPKSTKLETKKKLISSSGKKFEADRKKKELFTSGKKKSAPIYMTEAQYIDYLKEKNTLLLPGVKDTSNRVQDSNTAAFPPTEIKEGKFEKIKNTAWQSPSSTIALRKDYTTDIIPYKPISSTPFPKYNYGSDASSGPGTASDYPLQKADYPLQDTGYITGKPILINRDNLDNQLSVKDFERVEEIKSPSNINIRQYSRGSEQKSPIVTIVQ